MKEIVYADREKSCSGVIFCSVYAMRYLGVVLFVACAPDPSTYNADPVADIVSHREGSIFVVGYPQEIRVQISDPNHASEDLQ